MMKYRFEKATLTQAEQIWQILSNAITRRKNDGSDQWQDGYPNPSVIEMDIKGGNGFVIADNNVVVAYCAILINDEPEYAKIKGHWLTDSDFVVFHRVAVSALYLGQGLSKLMLRFIEEFAIRNNIYSIRADTNFDNKAMLAVFQKAGYIYCGEVSFRGSPRKAFEKVLKPQP